MKIAQIHPYPPIIKDQVPVLPGHAAQGGGETSSYDFARNLSLRGHDVTYYAAKYPGITVNELVLSKNFRVRYFSSWFANLGLAGSPSLFFELIREKYDVIQTHQIPMISSIIAGVSAKLTRAKFLMTFHGRVAYFFVDENIGRIAAMLADYVTVQNEFGYKKIQKMVDRDKIKFIPHGVSIDLFSKMNPSKSLKKSIAPNGEKVILYVGRIILAKGLTYLISSLELVNKKVNAKILLVGSGQLESELKHQVKELNLENKVIFTGQVNQLDTRKYYSLADVYVLPAVDRDKSGNLLSMVSENFGNSLLEAMSYKIPVVASSVGGIPEWITDGFNGYICPQRDPLALSKAILRVFQKPNEAEKITSNALSLIDTKYSWQAVCKEFEKLYEKELL